MTVYYYHVTHKSQSESTLYSLPECQGTPCSKQVPYLKSKLFSLKKRDPDSCFSVNFPKFLKIPVLAEHLRWLLL